MKPSKAISACDGIGSPVRGPAITSIGPPIRPPGHAVPVLAVGNFQSGD
jgi:hypothetical protein